MRFMGDDGRRAPPLSYLNELTDPSAQPKDPQPDFWSDNQRVKGSGGQGREESRVSRRFLTGQTEVLRHGVM